MCGVLALIAILLFNVLAVVKFTDLSRMLYGSIHDRSEIFLSEHYMETGVKSVIPWSLVFQSVIVGGSATTPVLLTVTG